MEEFGVSGDFQTLSYGFTNHTVNVFSRASNVFTQGFTYPLGTTTPSVKMDNLGLYYVAIANDQKLYTFYQCPEGCSNCSFPNNCSDCKPGYLLQGTTCTLMLPTQCINNVVLKNNVCV